MASLGFSPAAPLVFNSEGFHIWVVKMRTYLQAFDLWEVINSDAELAPLTANPTVAQIRQHADESTNRHKAMSCIQNRVSDVIFTRIMACETPKQAWDKLKEEFQGTERTRQQQLLNLRRDFENLKIKEEETVKQYSDRIMAVVNSIRLLGEQFSEARIMEKVLSTFPKRYEAKISSLEDSKDLASISLIELINALYAQEQRRAKALSSTTAYKSKKNLKNRPKPDATRRGDQPCRHCKRPGHPEDRCWFRPDALCQHCKKNGHVKRVCKNKGRPRQNQTQQKNVEAQVAEDSSGHEEQVFVVSCSAGNKIISNVLLVLEIDRNLLSIAQLLEKGYSIVFKGKECQTADPNGSSLMSVTMTDKCFEFKWPSDSHLAYVASTEDSKLWH
ncbi:hypothetical protein CXB51_024470 [Gossypium anomalum]|uniref:DUF4219 domain-containing protein n=1 Tax=Gossypium anomalum TaxID=47600 RepID=A0A8J6CTK4_9ROSI|nr:hypothetical protein CXB51_024470 [Gossypium anomalum]